MTPVALSGSLLRDLGLIIVAGALCAVVARRIHMPSIVAYLLAGLVLGPWTGAVRVTAGLELISHTGIALLLFLVGLELSIAKVRDVGRVAVVAGLGQVVFTAVIGFALCWLLEFTVMESLFLAIALTFSSTVVVVKLLDEKKELDQLYGRIAVGIFLVQDVVAIVFLTFLAGLGNWQSANWWSLSRELLQAFGGMSLLLALVLGAARWALPGPLAWAARAPDTLFIWSLAWCFLIVLLAKTLGLSLEIGAFLAGLSLAQLPYNQDLRRRVHPLMNFFIAVFFVTLGVQTDFAATRTHLWSTTVLTLFVLIGNPLIFIWIIARMGYSERTSFFTGVTVAQISEFSFIFVALGVSAGLVTPAILSITALVGLLTMALSAYLILFSAPLYRRLAAWGWLRPFRAAPTDPRDQAEPPPGGHIIVVGMNTLGREIARRLHARGERVLAIDTDPRKLAGLPCETMLGNVAYAATLEEAGLARARLLVSALHIEEINDLLAFRCRAAGVPCAVNVVDLSLTDNLLELEAAYLMVPKVDGVKLQARELQKLGLLPP
jgi:Kef-type K+ transport system membrane component KefB